MKIRLDRIGAEPFRWQETVCLAAESLDCPELLALGEIAASGQVWVDRPGFRLQGSLSYDQTLACARCLTPIIQAVNSPIRLRILTHTEEPTAPELELSLDDLELVYLEGEELDTAPIVREQLQLNVPMRTVCKEDCRGLCPLCGCNRNEEDCSCEPTERDPRWNMLRGLKPE